MKTNRELLEAALLAIRQGADLLESPAATDGDFDRLADRFRALLVELPNPAPVPLTIVQLNECARDAQIDFCMGKESSFEVAFARRIEEAHGVNGSRRTAAHPAHQG